MLDLGSNAITPTVTGSLSYVPGVVGLGSLNLVNAAGVPATQYITGNWAGASNVTISFWMNPQSLGATQMVFSTCSGVLAVLMNPSNQLYHRYNPKPYQSLNQSVVVWLFQRRRHWSVCAECGD